MGEVHVRVPIRITLVGEPGPEELAAVRRQLTSSVAARLVRAERMLPRYGAGPGPGAGPAGERFDGGRDGGGGYAVPSYDGGGRPARIPVRGRAPAQPWTVVRTVRTRMAVDRFLAFVAETLGHPLPFAVLYEAQAGVEFPLEVSLVRVDAPALPADLGEALLRTAAGAARPAPGVAQAAPARTEPAWVLTASSAALRALHALDRGGPVPARIPALQSGHVLFASMALPRIDVKDVAALGPGLGFTVPVREAGFCVDPVHFQQRTGVAWDRYAQEFGAEEITVWLQPAVVRPSFGPARGADGRVREDVMFELLDRHASGGGAQHRDPTARLFTQEGEGFPGLPDAVRRRAEWPDEPGTRVLFARAHPDLAPERLDAAYFRPVARQLVRQFLDRLRAKGDAGRAVDALLDEVVAPQHRGRPGSLFGHVLAELEREGALDEVFDALEGTGRFALRAEWLRNCSVTPYARHPRVQRLRTALAAERTTTAAHGYVPGGEGQGAILLEHQERKKVVAGHVLAEGDGIYSRRVPGMRPKSGKAEAFRGNLLRERHRLAEEILTGRDTGVYDAKEFSATALARAAKAAGLTEDDFEKIVVEYTIRLLDVIAAERDGLPSYDVRFEIVSRTAGSGEEWQSRAGPLVEPFGEFEARLVQWGALRSGEAIQVVNLIVVGTGALVVGWSVGIVGILIQLGGGLKTVASSILLSEVIYALKIVFGDEHLTAEGFAMAAVEGYLNAVGFRFGSGLGGWAGKLGTRALRSAKAGEVASKLVTGSVSGASAAALDQFARDLVDVTLHDGAGSDTETYVRGMGIGAAFGVFFSFVGDPALHAAYQAVTKRLGPTVAKVAIVAQLFAAEGVTARQWGTATATGQQRMEQTLAGTLRETEAAAWAKSLGLRMDEVGEELARIAPGRGGAPETGAKAAGPRAGARPVDPHAAQSPAPPGTPSPALPPGQPGTPKPVLPRPGPPLRWLTRKELEDAARGGDREAMQDLNWYETASYEQLRAREAVDPVARQIIDSRYGGVRRPYAPDLKTSSPAMQARLARDLVEVRRQVEAERAQLPPDDPRNVPRKEPRGWQSKRTWGSGDEPELVPPTAKAAAGYQGTIAVARSDVPALAAQRFDGGSYLALGEYSRTHEIRPGAKVTNIKAHGHAEQALGQQLSDRMKTLTPAELAGARGRTVWIRVDQEVCSACAAGIVRRVTDAGVLRKLSEVHPDIVFEITADDTSKVYRLVGGRLIE
ncbi:hypothetical protein DMB38_13220 [Streptomyces sp. WAC 06738]|uniref:hypothetical protein n=1 Tax=Streptomyces sp. WAC 06738 TaxID=2203210 RepID=UPI000F6D20A4|nr:hypothetical protein [Streptomyces sp. WAC 06738]AZM46640.1 hypothetical protein DMB38_13220 [Streptomyces sp. WAC 06738]